MGNPLRILVVEDSENDALLLLRELKRGGYEPTCERVDTPLAMINALDNHPWDLVISDHRMPHFNSNEALSLLRERDSDIPFVIVSGTLGEENAVLSMKAGANDYFLKGKLTRLCSAIERELREAEIRRTNKMADRFLKESEEKYRSLVENIPVVTWRANQNGDFVFISPNLENIVGYTPIEMYEKKCGTWMDKIHVEDASKVQEVYQKLFQKNEIFNIEYRIQKKDGQWVWIDDRAVAVFERNGTQYADGVFSDITKRKNTEDDLKKRITELEALVKKNALEKQ